MNRWRSHAPSDGSGAAAGVRQGRVVCLITCRGSSLEEIGAGVERGRLLHQVAQGLAPAMSTEVIHSISTGVSALTITRTSGRRLLSSGSSISRLNS